MREKKKMIYFVEVGQGVLGEISESPREKLTKKEFLAVAEKVWDRL